jgi:hypothetical protein
MGTNTDYVVHWPSLVGEEALCKATRVMEERTKPSKTSSGTIMTLSPHARNLADTFKQ